MSTFFHVTTEDALKSILADGLVPSIGLRSAEANELTPAVFAFPDRESLEDGLFNWLGDAFEDYDGELVIVEFNYTGTHNRRDVDWEIAILEPVPPSQFVRLLDERLETVRELQPAIENQTLPTPRRVTNASSTFEP